MAVPPADRSRGAGPDLCTRTAAGRARAGCGALERQRAEASTAPRRPTLLTLGHPWQTRESRVLASQASDSRLKPIGLNLSSTSQLTSNLSLSKSAAFLLPFFAVSVCQTEVANIPTSEGVCCKNIKFIHLTQDPTTENF